MKSKYIKKIIITALFLGLLFSCNNGINNKKTDNEATISIYVSLPSELSDSNNVGKRTLFPASSTETFTDMWIQYKQAGSSSNYILLEEWNNFSSIRPFPITAGTYDFQFIAEDLSGIAYCGTITNKTIEVGPENILNFELEIQGITFSGGRGTFELNLTFPSSVQAANATLKRNVFYPSAISGYENIPLTITPEENDKSSVKFVSNEGGISPNEYVAIISLYADEEKTLEVASYEETILVAENKESKANREITKVKPVYTITYHLPDDAEWESGFTPVTKFTTKSIKNLELPSKWNVRKDYYKLEGWYDNENLTGDKINAQDLNGNIDLYPCMKKNYVTVSELSTYLSNIPDTVTSCGIIIEDTNPSVSTVQSKIKNSKTKAKIKLDMTLCTNLTKLNDYAFYGNTKLSELKLPKTFSEIGNYLFEGCTSLENIIVDEQNSLFSTLDGVLYDKDKTVLQNCPPAKTGTFTIPESVQSIGSSAFLDSALTKIILPSNLLSIWDSVFKNSLIASITIPSSTIQIGQACFNNCNNLEEIIFENKYAWFETNYFNDWITSTAGTMLDVSDAVANAKKLIEHTNIYLYHKNAYQITLELNGGTSEYMPDLFISGGSTELPVPTKENYIFDGWYTSSDFEPTSKITELPDEGYDFTQDLTLYAKWNNTLNITINFGITDIKITENTDSVTGVTTLTADTGYTDYTWKIDDEAPDGTNVSIDSENPNILTINSLSHGVYGITVFAKKNGITYSSFMQVKVQ